MIELKLLNSLAKVYPDLPLDESFICDKGSMLLGDRFSFQAAFRLTDRGQCPVTWKVDSDLGRALSVRYIDYVPCDNTAPDECRYLCDHPLPGLMPDILRPVPRTLWAYRSSWRALFITVDTVNNKVAPGKYTVTVTLGDGADTEAVFELEVLDYILSGRPFPVTNWFHADAICNYYSVGFATNEYWRIAGKFAACAVEHGISALLTPIFTPPLDTAPGGERLTTQLVRITEVAPYDGVRRRLSFDFSDLETWVDVCRNAGVSYFEISHLFTQWGCAHAPKIVYYPYCGSEPEKLFGWETDGTGAEYLAFLDEFLPALKAKLTLLGVMDKCFFHISDEPSGAAIETYKKGMAKVAQYIPKNQIIDALSDVEFALSGVVSNPVASLNAIDSFIDAHVENLWGYYCCGEIRTSNRLVAMPSVRNRVLGWQLFRYDIKGFLQWGYNFYNTFLSREKADPYGTCTAGGWVPGGDPFVVYPGENGEPVASLRLEVFYDALRDRTALYALYKKMINGSGCEDGESGRVKVLSELGIGSIPFVDFSIAPGEILAARERLNRLLAERA